ncbi:MAG TPA: O-antigen ligase family protein [Verrucomicrobiae bacterium]|nr:O-antigen ligase family protein [Verrucomicrobiae bacterium]
METKQLIAAAYLVIAAMGGITVTCLSKRARDGFFFLLVTMAALTERWDVNFVSREWYRGTTMGFEFSLVDVIALSLLVSAILVPRAGEKRFYWPPALGWMLLFFFFAVLCVAVATPKLFGYFALVKMLRGLIVFLAVALYVRGERELRIFLWALGAIVCFEALQAIEQRYRYGIHRVFGDLNAPNSLSMYMCTTAPLFVAAFNSRLPRSLKVMSAATIALAGVAVLLTISRTGIVTIGLIMLGTVALTMDLKFTGRKVLIATACCLAVAGALAKSWESLTSRFKEATLEEEYENKRSQGRGYYIRLAAAMADEQWLGVGPNNWSFWVSNKYGPRMGFKFAPYPSEHKEPRFEVSADANVDDPQAAPAHSLLALTAGEMGLGGLVLMLLLWMRWGLMGLSFLLPRNPDPMRTIGIGIFFGLVGNFLQGLTEWVWHQTAIFFTFNILLGVLSSLYYLKRKARREARRAQQLEDEWEDEAEPGQECVQEEEAQYARTASA